jgi:hypothetical protein
VKRTLIGLALAAGIAVVPAAMGAGANAKTLYISSAVENGDDTATFPLRQGITADGRSVSYIVLDASTSAAAKRYGVNRAAKLAKAKGSAAVVRVTIVGGKVVFPATVDFAPTRTVIPGPTGFPPLAAEPGARDENWDKTSGPHYTPLIQLPDGTILNAPHVANATGQADKVISIDVPAGRVRFQETNGFSRGKAVRYVSTDASAPDVAALEGVTFAPVLATATFAGGDGTDSARASLAVFVNGQTGGENPNRQGLASALLDGKDPLNLLAWKPNQGRYSPLWDVHPAAWTDAAIAAGANVRQTEFAKVQDLARDGLVTGPGGAPFGAANIVVNCPIVSEV